MGHHQLITTNMPSFDISGATANSSSQTGQLPLIPRLDRAGFDSNNDVSVNDFVNAHVNSRNDQKNSNKNWLKPRKQTHRLTKKPSPGHINNKEVQDLARAFTRSHISTFSEESFTTPKVKVGHVAPISSSNFLPPLSSFPLQPNIAPSFPMLRRRVHKRIGLCDGNINLLAQCQ